MSLLLEKTFFIRMSLIWLVGLFISSCLPTFKKQDESQNYVVRNASLNSAPTILKYSDSASQNSTSSFRYKQNAVVQLTPQTSGGVATSYSLSSADNKVLTDFGLNFDSVTGVISSKPGSSLVASPVPISISVIAVNSVGSSPVFPLSIAIEGANLLTILGYSDDAVLPNSHSSFNFKYPQNSEVQLLPQISGGVASSYSISQADKGTLLSLGLRFTPLSGMISSTEELPLSIGGPVTINVIASNAEGSSAVFQLTIAITEPVAPTILGYSDPSSVGSSSSFTYALNSIVQMKPNISGGTPTSFSLNTADIDKIKSLGLSFSSSCGEIFSSPETPLEPTNTPVTVNVMAMNSAGYSRDFPVTIAINRMKVVPTILSYEDDALPNQTSSFTYSSISSPKITPNVAGGVPTSYNLSDTDNENLRRLGLNFVPSTGMISAAAGVELLEGSVTVNMTASNAAGSSTASKLTITIKQQNEYVQVVNADSNTASLYSLDSETGLLVPLDSSVAVPTGKTSTGNIPTRKYPNGMVLDPSGRYGYMVNANMNTVSIYKLNSTTETLVSTVSTRSSPNKIVFEPSGHYAYVVNKFSNDISMYRLDKVTGLLAPLAVPTIATEIYPVDMVFDREGRHAYVVNNASNSISIYELKNIGVLNLLTTVSTGSSPQKIKVIQVQRHTKPSP